MVPAHPAMTGPSANNGSDQAIHCRDGSGNDSCGGDGVSAKTNEKGWQKCRNSSDGKRPHGHAKGSGPESRIPHESAQGGAVKGGLKFIACSTRRFLYKEPEGGCDQHSGQSGNKEGHAPTVMLT